MKNNISESDSHIKALKQQFEHQLTLLYGVEIAQPAMIRRNGHLA